jgi:hypothetical protein
MVGEENSVNLIKLFSKKAQPLAAPKVLFSY